MTSIQYKIYRFQRKQMILFDERRLSLTKGPFEADWYKIQITLR